MARESLEHVVKEPIHQVVESLVLPNCNSKLESCRESMLLSITSIQNHFEPVYLNVYDLLAEHQRLSFVMNDSFSVVRVEDWVHITRESKFTEWKKHYDLLKRNCNHFTNDFLRRLLGINLPPWVNRFERCVITTPGCTKFLSKLFGKDWTKPTL
ncbi:unnamed protein product [Didymodactylos carnosus]|uniref:PPPDE domain-containing protein n=1 Tax=Didymodactylos carnosus TaxID=1234261 RepID=A0A813YNF0_9BILA|nr:unnamed protein product [Didymodactylos carnosus]CAF1223939.1 unnamed protein product [Didymodactylos carnosus]CAF3672273.1 unnamed protein product [Didymodactylos carnosus]CAF4032071.1 unnamed protein product [Didymodactylos carnosus]